MKQSDNHIVELQSLRGIASMMVVGAHTLGYFATPRWFDELHELSNGQAAVIIFFVLSGYVLTKSLQHSDFSAHALAGFYTKRVFRIYPALWAASLLGLAYLVVLHYGVPVPGISQWFSERFKADRMAPLYIVASFAGALAFILPPIWTVFVEIVASIFMPGIAFAAWHRRTIFAGILIGLGLASLLVGPDTYYGVLLYAVDFAIGASICIWPARLIQGLRNLGSLRGVLFGAAAVTLIGVPFATGSTTNPWLQLVVAISAATMIGLVVHGGLRMAVLQSRAAAWLGDISYSVYVFHFPVMCLIAKAFLIVSSDPATRFGSIPLSLALFGLTTLVTLPLSHLVFQRIEKPGIAAGRAMAQRWRSHLGDAQPSQF